MSKIVAYMMILNLLGAISYNLIQVSSFLVNQNEIIAEYCVNQSDPITMCGGKCHLEKQLVGNLDTDLPFNGLLANASLLCLLGFTPIEETALEFVEGFERSSFSEYLSSSWRYIELDSPPPELSA